MHFPPLPELPEFLRGRSVVVIDGAVLGPSDAAAETLAPLRALAPELDTFGLLPPVGLSRIHMDPEEPIPYLGNGTLLGALDDAAIDAWVAAAGVDSGTALMFSEIRHLGGALGRVPDGAGV